jgi:hypothetical protein
LNLPLEPAEPEAKAFSQTQCIDALLDFLPKFESDGASAGEWSPVETRDGCTTMPSFDMSPELSGFMHALYRYGWIAKFDWGEWQDEAARLVESPEALASADIETIQKLLTTHARKERYCEGHLAAMFKCGHLAAVLRRLKDISGMAGKL